MFLPEHHNQPQTATVGIGSELGFEPISLGALPGPNGQLVLRGGPLRDYLNKLYEHDPTSEPLIFLPNPATGTPERQLHPPDEPVSFFGGKVVVDSLRRTLRRDGEFVPKVPAKVLNLLEYLGHNAGIACSREQIIDTVWDGCTPDTIRTVDVHVLRARSLTYPNCITTLRGYGYRAEPAYIELCSSNTNSIV